MLQKILASFAALTLSLCANSASLISGRIVTCDTCGIPAGSNNLALEFAHSDAFTVAAEADENWSLSLNFSQSVSWNIATDSPSVTPSFYQDGRATTPTPDTVYIYGNNVSYSMLSSEINNPTTSYSTTEVLAAGGSIIHSSTWNALFTISGTGQTIIDLNTPFYGITLQNMRIFSSGDCLLPVGTTTNETCINYDPALEVGWNVTNLGSSNLANLSVTSVPVPTAAWLLGSALTALVGIKRKFQK